MVTSLEQEPILPELLWYMGRHSKQGDSPENAVDGLPDFPNDTDSRQTEPPDSPIEQSDSKNDLEH